MALFSQTSTTGSVIGFSLFILLSIIFTISDFRQKKIYFSASQIAYLTFFSICLLSIVVNYKDYVVDWGNIQKARYFLFAVLTSFAFRHLYRINFFTKFRLKVLTNLVLIGITLVTIGSYIGREIGFNIFKMQSIHEKERLEGVVSVGNYGMELPILVLIFLAILINYKKVSFLINKKFLIACLIINLSAIYYSGMRTALYGFVIAMPFLFFFHGKRKFLIVSGIATVLITIVIGGIYFQKFNSRQFLSINNESNTMRISMWKKSIEAFKEKPILGHGYLSHNLKYLAEDSSGKEVIPLHIAHSSYFQVLKDTGLMGILSFLLFLFLWCKNIIVKNNILSRLSFAAFICSLFHGVAHNFLINGSNSAMLLAVLYAVSELDFEQQETTRKFHDPK